MARKATRKKVIKFHRGQKVAFRWQATPEERRTLCPPRSIQVFEMEKALGQGPFTVIATARFRQKRARHPQLLAIKGPRGGRCGPTRPWLSGSWFMPAPA